MSDTTEMRAAGLLRQRRFLVVMSLALAAYYLLGAGVQSEAQYSGLILTLDRPDRAVFGLWIVWGWALWRYGQRAYEQLSVLWDEVVQDVEAEDRRMALARAKRLGNSLAARGEIEGIPQNARIVGRVEIRSPQSEDMLGEIEDGEMIPNFYGYFATSDGRRKYSTLQATFAGRRGKGFKDIQFSMEMSRRAATWLRIRAWLHSLLRLPGFSEHFAPVLIAAVACAIGIISGGMAPDESCDTSGTAGHSTMFR